MRFVSSRFSAFHADTTHPHLVSALRRSLLLFLPRHHSNCFTSTTEDFGNWIKARLDKIGGYVSGALKNIKDQFGKWLNDAGEWLEGLNFKDGVKDLTDAAKDGIEDAGKAVADAAKGVVSCKKPKKKWWQSLKLWC